jgi:hypothetical protein
MLLFLLAGHALMDFALQSETMARCKCRRSPDPIQQSVPWYYWLTAHALLHGAIVGVVFYWGYLDWYLAVWFAAAETVAHWVIDFGKCERLYGIHIDQGLHVLCKVAWWGLVASGVISVPG